MSSANQQEILLGGDFRSASAPYWSALHAQFDASSSAVATKEPSEEVREDATAESKEAPAPVEETEEELMVEAKEAPPPTEEPTEEPSEEVREDATADSKEAPAPEEEKEEEAVVESMEAPLPVEEATEAIVEEREGSCEARKAPLVPPLALPKDAPIDRSTLISSPPACWPAITLPSCPAPDLPALPALPTGPRSPFSNEVGLSKVMVESREAPSVEKAKEEDTAQPKEAPPVEETTKEAAIETMESPPPVEEAREEATAEAADEDKHAADESESLPEVVMPYLSAIAPTAQEEQASPEQEVEKHEEASGAPRVLTPCAAVPAVPSSEQDDVGVYTIRVEKPHDSSLGVQIALHGDGSAPVVEKVCDGVLKAWNDSHPNEQIKRGDWLLKVNGVTDHTKFVDEVQKAEILELKFFRPVHTDAQFNDPGSSSALSFENEADSISFQDSLRLHSASSFSRRPIVATPECMYTTPLTTPIVGASFAPSTESVSPSNSFPSQSFSTMQKTMSDKVSSGIGYMKEQVENKMPLPSQVSTQVSAKATQVSAKAHKGLEYVKGRASAASGAMSAQISQTAQKGLKLAKTFGKSGGA